jgi:aspartyl-tRNA(Asn)/glutamyl-tRNA(Gln) amidotransferase subunit A
MRNIAAAIAARTISPVEVMETVLGNIERLEPRLHAFLCINPKARQEAVRAETAVQGGQRLGPLHGVPISVKDLILTRGMRTTAGSRTFGAGLPGTRDAPVVRRLRRAGAIIVGKTNLHEIAMGVTTENEHFGPTRNPWDVERIPGGSSGGSAAAVAAGLGYGSVGTDTRGSIRIPAACCGITGLKPTYGLVSTEGVIPLSWTLDHVGPMTRSVEDAALMLGVMTGRRGAVERYLAATALEVTSLRLGICEYYLRDLDPEVGAAVQEAIDLLRRSGVAIREVSVPELEGAQAASAVITGAEALAYHDERLRQQPEGFGPLVRQRLEKASQLTAVELVRAERKQLELMAAFERVFEEVDCLVGATIPILPPKIGEQASILDSVTRLNSPQNMAGLPALSLPCGFSRSGLPIGLQVMANRNREDVVFRIGGHYQRETDWHRRRPPA